MAGFTLSQENDLIHLEEILELDDLKFNPFSGDINLHPVTDYSSGFEGMYTAPFPHQMAEETEQRELVATNDCMSPTGTLPCMDHYKGPLDFEILLDGSTSHKRSWVYSIILHKVFLDINKVLLMQFKTNKTVPGLRIRALPVFTAADKRRYSVDRCTIHSVEVDPQCLAHKEEGKCLCADYQWVGHIIRSTHQDVRYEYNPQSGRHSITVPLDSVQPGSDTVTVPYHFTCKTSCMGGMNRKPIDVIFTLETSLGAVIGRQTLSFKICSCPKRDKKREETDDKVNKEDAERLGLEIPVRPGKRKIKRDIKDHEAKIIKKENVATPAVTTNTNFISNEQIKQIQTEFTDNIQIMWREMAREMDDRITQLTANMDEKIQQLFTNNN